MAQSRLEKIGTIFTRVTGLLRAEAMKPEDKPIWYDVYAAFPPKLEPRYDRPAPNVPIKSIFYSEDITRAKFHKSEQPLNAIHLLDTHRITKTQHFIKIYESLKSEGALDEEQIFATAVDMLKAQRQRTDTEDDSEVPSSESKGTAKTDPGVGSVDIKTLFKD